jgi:hypothetical protein
MEREGKDRQSTHKSQETDCKTFQVVGGKRGDQGPGLHRRVQPSSYSTKREKDIRLKPLKISPVW